MKRSRFTDEQIIGMLKEQEAGLSTAEVCRKHGVSQATFYKYNACFGGLEVSDARRLRALEDENAKLRKLLVEQMLDNAILRDVAKKVVAMRACPACVRREAVAYACASRGVSQRRACQALAVDRSSVRYRSIRPDDAEARMAMQAAASERRQFGYRRIHVMRERQGIVMNLKKLRRQYREEKLQVRRRGGRKRALGTRRPLLVPDAANQRWSLDFVSDALTDGRRFRILAVVDDFTRECLALVALAIVLGPMADKARPRCQGCEWFGNSTRSSLGGASLRPSSTSCQWKRHWSERPLATGPSSSPLPSWPGASARRLAGITSRPTSRCETRLRRELQRPAPGRAAQ